MTKQGGLPADPSEAMGYRFGTVVGSMLLGLFVWSLVARKWILAGGLAAFWGIVFVAVLVSARSADPKKEFVEGCERGCLNVAHRSPDAKVEGLCSCFCSDMAEQMSPDLMKRAGRMTASEAQQDPETRQIMNAAVERCVNAGESAPGSGGK
jgi:hypothetical protein